MLPSLCPCSGCIAALVHRSCRRPAPSLCCSAGSVKCPRLLELEYCALTQAALSEAGLPCQLQMLMAYLVLCGISAHKCNGRQKCPCFYPLDPQQMAVFALQMAILVRPVHRFWRQEVRCTQASTLLGCLQDSARQLPAPCCPSRHTATRAFLLRPRAPSPFRSSASTHSGEPEVLIQS